MSTSSRRRLAREEGRVLRVATYRRISTNEVNQPHSLEAQERSLKDYIATHPELVFACDYADQQTGTNNHRPGLETMLDDAATGAFDVVLFYRLDRLARSVYGFMDITNRLEAANVAVRSATEPFETMTPAGKLMAQMLASFAEFEHSILIDRILEAFETKAMKGEWLGGRAPYGYLNNKEDKSLTVQPEEAAVVRRVFTAYQTGKGAKTIAEELNLAGITHRGGKKWYPEAVLRLLEGAVYAGLIAHGDERYPGLHEAIVSPDEMAAVAAIRSTRNRREQATRPAMGLTDYILTGVTRCGECGGSMVGTGAHGQGGSYRYYTCNLQTKRAESERCRNESVAADELEDMVTQAVLNAYQDTELFELAVSMATAETPHQAAELDEQASSVRAAIATSQAALERYFAAFEEGALDAVSMQKRVEALETRLTAQRAELARLIEAAAELQAGGGTLVDLSAALDQVTQALSAKDGYHEKKRILGALVESVTVSKGRNVDVVLRVPTVNSSGPGQVLPGGRTRRAATHARRRQRDVESSEEGYRDPLVRRESALEWTPVRTGSHMVALARTTPGSKGRQRVRARLAKRHRAVANTRRHLVHQVSKTLVMRAQVLVLEDLNVAGMVRNRHLARSISDAAMGELSRQILYKARWHGVEVRVADRFFPSSKTCSGCGGLKNDLDLSTRTYSCEACGLMLDRDLNAAINLARWQPNKPLTVTPLGPTRVALRSTA